VWARIALLVEDPGQIPCHTARRSANQTLSRSCRPGQTSPGHPPPVTSANFVHSPDTGRVSPDGLQPGHRAPTRQLFEALDEVLEDEALDEVLDGRSSGRSSGHPSNPGDAKFWTPIKSRSPIWVGVQNFGHPELWPDLMGVQNFGRGGGRRRGWLGMPTFRDTRRRICRLPCVPSTCRRRAYRASRRRSRIRGSPTRPTAERWLPGLAVSPKRC